MQVESLSCNNCGAPIDVPANANYATCAHCGSRLAIKRTETAAYTEVLSRIDERTGQMSEDLAVIKAQNELEQVDREWQLEREQYLERNKDGSSSVPSTGRTVALIVGGIVMVLFACIWISIAFSMGGGPSFSPGPSSSSPYPYNSSPGIPIFPLFGFVFIAIVVIGVIVSVVKTAKYGEAERSYRERRDAALRRLRRKR